jgi:hypothetical protein
VGFVVEKSASGTGAGFLRVLRFPLPNIPQISPSSYSPGAGTVGLLVAAVPIGPNWTPTPFYQLTKIKIFYVFILSFFVIHSLKNACLRISLFIFRALPSFCGVRVLRVIFL